MVITPIATMNTHNTTKYGYNYAKPKSKGKVKYYICVDEGMYYCSNNYFRTDVYHSVEECLLMFFEFGLEFGFVRRLTHYGSVRYVIGEFKIDISKIGADDVINNVSALRKEFPEWFL